MPELDEKKAKLGEMNKVYLFRITAEWSANKRCWGNTIGYHGANGMPMFSRRARVQWWDTPVGMHDKLARAH